MPFTSGAVLLTLGASTSYALLDAVRKKLVIHVPPLPLTALMGFGQLPLFAAWLLVTGVQAPRAGYLPELAGSAAFGLLGNLLFIRSVQVSPLSLTIPFLSFSPVFTLLFSGVLLGELPRPVQALGIAWVVVGAFLLNLAREDLTHPALFFRGVTRERGSLMMLATALMWALGSIFDKRALVHASAPLHALLQAACVGLCVLALLALRRELGTLGEVRRCGRLFALSLVVSAAAQLFQFFALPLVIVSLFEAIKRCIGMTLAVLNGALMFGEPVTGQKLLGIALMGTGVVLILL